MAQSVTFKTEAERERATAKLQEMLTKGISDSTTALEGIKTEFEKRRDLIVRPAAMDFDISGQGIRPVIQENPYTLTTHARTQLLNRAGVPSTYADKLLEYGEYDLLKNNLRRMLVRTSSDGILVRHVDQTAKGILSSSYKRMDASPMFQGFYEEASRIGLAPFRGLNTDTRYALTVIHPEILEISPGEYILAYLQILTSDYGAGAQDLNMGVVRFWCTNLALGPSILRNVHLGRRFDSGSWNGSEIVELSTRTQQLDTRTLTSAVRDAVRSFPRQLAALTGQIEQNMGKEVKMDATLAQLKKSGFDKETLEKIKTTYESELPVEALPQDAGAWRMSNVLSLLAKSATGDKKLEMEKAAFQVLVA